MERPQRLTAAFVEKVDEPGRYTDGRGSHGLSCWCGPEERTGLAKNWQQQLRWTGGSGASGWARFPTEARRGPDPGGGPSGEAQGSISATCAPGVVFRAAVGRGEGRSLSVYPTFARGCGRGHRVRPHQVERDHNGGAAPGLVKTYLNPVLGDLEIDRIASSTSRRPCAAHGTSSRRQPKKCGWRSKPLSTSPRGRTTSAPTPCREPRSD